MVAGAAADAVGVVVGTIALLVQIISNRGCCSGSAVDGSNVMVVILKVRKEKSSK